ncbi:bacteriocin [Mammaliicoccus stepanovicii]|nr:bacteriocin [Mammaliicoccus stepanovicii]PNZ71606.1 enterocin B precursor [Mammaliicoccus stepanovicii]GGI40719.1 hypothetical protein GCM10010896_09770 [Mammaliicoccus stepanovicii]
MKKISKSELKKINGGDNKRFWEGVGKAAGATAYCTANLGYTNLIPGATGMCAYLRYNK